jgi:hypothetical protein
MKHDRKGHVLLYALCVELVSLSYGNSRQLSSDRGGMTQVAPVHATAVDQLERIYNGPTLIQPKLGLPGRSVVHVFPYCTYSQNMPVCSSSILLANTGL